MECRLFYRGTFVAINPEIPIAFGIRFFIRSEVSDLSTTLPVKSGSDDEKENNRAPRW
jgi:hypothetical protein